jgi:hypothetical protein
VTVVAHDHQWSGVVERYDDVDPAVSADLTSLVVGANRVAVGPSGYDVVIDLPEHGIGGELHLAPVGRSSVVAVSGQPVGAGRLSWLAVPRLRADGWFRIGGRQHRFTGDVAYHDHNWGHFRWGDDFGWTWGSILPADPRDPWSFVFACITDRHRLRTFTRAFYVWYGDEPVASLRDSAVRMRSSGVLDRPPDCTLPPPMRLVLGGRTAPVPATIEIMARRGADTLHAEIHLESSARLAHPSEIDLTGSVVLSETSGTALVTGSVAGREMDFAGSSVFEVLHG